MNADLVEIAAFSSENEALVAKSSLEAAGIEVMVRKDDCGGMQPQLQLTLGVKLYVDEKDADAAREIVAEARSGETERKGENAESND